MPNSGPQKSQKNKSGSPGRSPGPFLLLRLAVRHILHNIAGLAMEIGAKAVY
nr:MAG TPA: hypothetical protein [Caudoviricetes sp.]